VIKSSVKQPPLPVQQEEEPRAIPLTPKKATIKINVPADAVVVVNGKKTTSTGEHREYVSHVYAGYVYDYTITVQVVRNGVVYESTRKVVIGDNTLKASLAFTAPPVSPATSPTIVAKTP
jgi:uncharacterized protein (TIGR03000 family)